MSQDIRDVLFDQIKNILKEKLDSDKEITLESNIMEDLHADSLSLIEIVMEVETKYSISIPTTESEKIKTVADMIAGIEAHLTPDQKMLLTGESKF